ncbi:unnamed protein product [Schistosoma haematobium]|nr:unnamed protein product [Schistosoma haematobium]CAH8493095.1 unnamed protein product [Schistosoma haematobium]
MMKFQLTQKFWFLVFIILNCFVAITSFILFVLSIKAEDNLLKYKLILQYTIPAIYPTGIFTGSLGLITACLGFIGLWKQMNILYLLHVICLSIATIINLCIAIVTLITDHQFFINAKQALDTTIKYYYKNDEYADEFDELHRKFFCCGVNSYADFKKAKVLIPFSCRVGQYVYARLRFLHPDGYCFSRGASYIGRCSRNLHFRAREHLPAWLNKGLMKVNSSISAHLVQTVHSAGINQSFLINKGCFDELSEYVQYYITLLSSICFTTSFIYAVFIGVAIRNLRKSIKGINSSS